VTPPSRVFAYEWQGKDLRDTECVRVASKGLTKRHFCALVQRTSSGRGMPPRVFCEKSAEVVENKGRESEKERKESLRVRKRKEIKEIEEVEGENPAGFVRDNTRNGTIDSVRLSIVNLSATLRRAYGGQATLLAVSASLAVHGVPAFAHDDGRQA
jgi:hypothetical protein